MNKPIKIILVLLVGLGLLGLLSFLAVTFVFNQSNTATCDGNCVTFSETLKETISDIQDNKVRDQVAEYQEGSSGVTKISADPGITTIMPPVYDNGGDGSKLVKSAFVAMTVSDFDKAVSGVKALVSQYKGYVINMYDSGVVNARAVTISVRVPSDKFDTSVTEIKALGVEVVSSSENSDDISATYKDLQARLKNQKAYEKQLLSILNRATKVSDILEIQREVSQVRQEIESMESQIKSFDTQVAMSVISVSMTKASEALDVTGNNWKPQGVFAEALTSLVSFGKSIATLIIWAVVFSPIVLVPYGIYYFVKKSKRA